MTRNIHREAFDTTKAEEVIDLVLQPSSVALLRLIAEVELGEAPNLDSYNRTYHRHNR